MIMLSDEVDRVHYIAANYSLGGIGMVLGNYECEKNRCRELK